MKLGAPSGSNTEGARGPLAPLLRAELFSVGQLEMHARKLAGWHELAPTGEKGPDLLLPRLAASEVVFKDAYALITSAVTQGRRITPAAEWFIDNYPLIEEQIRTARRHLPRGYSRELPRLKNPSSAGTPRVYDLAIELISHSHGRIDEDGLRAFMAAYRSPQPLTLGELWAIPIMLRLALLENLRRVVMGVTAGRHEREDARVWVGHLVAAASRRSGDVVLVLADMVRERRDHLSDAFAAELASRLQGHGPSLAIAIAWLEQRLAEHGQSSAHIFQLASKSQAADQVAIGNSIGSLRLLTSIDWREFVEGISIVERTLCTDPADIYGAMDFETRDRYRHAIEDIARRCSPSKTGASDTQAAGVQSDGVNGNGGMSEERVAAAAVRLATAANKAQAMNVQEAPSTPSPSTPMTAPTTTTIAPATTTQDSITAFTAFTEVTPRISLPTHVGWYLIDRGLPELERAVGAHLGLAARFRAFANRLALVGYLSGVALMTTIIAAVVGVVALTTTTTISTAGAGPALLGIPVGTAGEIALAVAMMGLLIVGASQVAVAIAHAVATWFVSPRILPRLAFTGGIPAEHTTLVAVPTLLSDADEVDALLDALEVRFLGSRQKNLAFALITDFTDAASEHTPGDAALLSRATAGIAALNARYAEDDVDANGGDGGKEALEDNNRRGGDFFLLHRARRFNACEGVWMGWERKRGKLEDL